MRLPGVSNPKDYREILWSAVLEIHPTHAARMSFAAGLLRDSLECPTPSTTVRFPGVPNPTNAAILPGVPNPTDDRETPRDAQRRQEAESKTIRAGSGLGNR